MTSQTSHRVLTKNRKKNSLTFPHSQTQISLTTFSILGEVVFDKKNTIIATFYSRWKSRIFFHYMIISVKKKSQTFWRNKKVPWLSLTTLLFKIFPDLPVWWEPCPYSKPSEPPRPPQTTHTKYATCTPPPPHMICHPLVVMSNKVICIPTPSSVMWSSLGSVRSIFNTRNLVWVLLEPTTKNLCIIKITRI